MIVVRHYRGYWHAEYTKRIVAWGLDRGDVLEAAYSYAGRDVPALIYMRRPNA